MPNGDNIAFARSGDGGWVSQQSDLAMFDLSEVKNPDGTFQGWRLKNGSETNVFDNKGYLTAVERNGVLKVSVVRNSAGQPISLVNPTGRVASIHYSNYVEVDRVDLPDGGSISYGYDNSNHLTSVGHGDDIVSYGYSSNGDTIELINKFDELNVQYSTFKYDDTSRAISTEHALGVNHYQVNYYDSGNHVTVVDPLGANRDFYFEVFNNGRRLVKSVDSCGGCAPSIVTYDYDTSGFMSGISSNGSSVKYEKDAKGRVEKIHEDLGGGNERVTEVVWDDILSMPTSVSFYENGGGNSLTQNFSYNAGGQALTASSTDLATGVTRTSTKTYCEQADIDAGSCPLLGLVTSVAGPNTVLDDTTHYTYYPTDDSTCATSPTTCPHRKGDLWKVTNALGQVTEYLAYDGAGRVLSVKDANGVVTDYTYHPRGWLTASKVRGADDSSESDDRITAIDYWPTGLVKQVTQPDGGFTRFTYDAAHRLTDIADNAGNTIHYTLDNAGNRSKEDTTDASGTLKRTLSRIYNQLGQLATQATAQGDPTDFGYDGNGNTKTVTDALGHATQNDYDPLNRLARTLQDVGGIAAETKFGYDALDNLTKVTDPKGLDTTYAYNGLGDLTKLTSPDTGSTTYTYDSAGNRATQTDARNIKTSYGYDALNRLTQVTYPTTSLNVSYTYDVSQSTCASGETYAVGRLTRMQDGSGSTDYCYDRFGDLVRKVQTTNGKVFVVRYAYTKAGQLSRLTYPDGAVVDYVRNAQGQTTEVGVTPPGGTRQVLLNQATYYPFGPVAGWTYGNGRPMQRVLDQDYRPLAVNDTRNDGLAVGFAFDPVGNLSALTAPGNTAPLIKLDYDPLGRLTAFKDGPTDTVIDGYTYDATGNRLSARVNTATQTYSYPTTSHRLNSVAGTARSYDAAGNTTAIGGTAVQYIYGANGRLIQVKRSGTTVANYAYNGRGEQVRRVGKTNVYTLYDESGHWLGDYDNNGTVVQQAIWLDDLPVGVLAKTTLRYVQPDQLGTPRAVIDPVRDMAIWRWDLKGEAFGATSPDQDPDKDGTAFVFDMRFPGQRYDALSGLNQNYFRDYEPGTGRYVQSDPIGLWGGQSTYVYSVASPLKWTDRFGLACDQRGCWNTPEELNASNSGNWSAYYALACAGGDPYACRAGEVAANAGDGIRGILSNITNRKLDASIVKNQPAVCPDDWRAEDLLRKKEGIRRGLMAARVAQLVGADSSNPRQVSRSSISDFHHDVFEANGASKEAFGGDLWDSIYGSFYTGYDWCKGPACRP
ncbi:RHS repeat-associated core domain-containing protein [Xanthomonas sacchari]|uniref:RHS repeat-associated core domain-containing protein n=1 Tax=Xanthomonas sacchari TaxID=56458 RepID=UPI002251912D|nr:RHS repeat-associated core domain-containing protein [Xanthomonas sacchari]